MKNKKQKHLKLLAEHYGGTCYAKGSVGDYYRRKVFDNYRVNSRS